MPEPVNSAFSEKRVSNSRSEAGAVWRSASSRMYVRSASYSRVMLACS